MSNAVAKRDEIEINQRILACMQRAPGGNYTAVQLARNTGFSRSEVQRTLTELHQAGDILRAPGLPYLAFQLAGQQPAVGRVTAREAADRQRPRPIG
jgi:DNA-binding IclR family transcriptional regulator